jgi:FkbM family methyltransferase
MFYEMEELEIIKRHYTGGGVFVDIGANVGNHVIHISRFAKARKIIVFEPNEEAISILRVNLMLNRCRNVDTRFLGIALAAREGRLRGAALFPNNLGSTFYQEDPSGEVVAIDGDTLIFDEPIKFIKIDVEGMEIDILSGLTKTIRRWRPNIFIEVWDKRLHPFLEWCECQSYCVTEQFQRYPGIQNYLIKPISNLASETEEGRAHDHALD